MKTRSLRFLALIALVLILIPGCKKDDSKFDLNGTWKITVAFGTEWKKDVGIITPKAADPETVNSTLIIAGSEFEFKDASGTSYGFGGIVLTSDKVTLTIDSQVLEFVLSNQTATGMQWDQREPNTASDYEERDPGQFLYYQKFWTLEKQ